MQLINIALYYNSYAVVKRKYCYIKAEIKEDKIAYTGKVEKRKRYLIAY